jgi:hypothetical protein
LQQTTTLTDTGDNHAGDTEDPWNDSVHTRLTFEVINYVYGLTIDVHVVLTDASEETIYLDGTGADGEWYFPYETWEQADIDLEARAQSEFGEGIAEVVGMGWGGQVLVE